MAFPEFNLQEFLDNKNKSNLLPAPPQKEMSDAATKFAINTAKPGLQPITQKGLVIPKFGSALKLKPGTNYQPGNTKADKKAILADPDKALNGGISFDPIPLINAATYVAANRGISNIERAQLNRKVLFQPTPQLSVRAIQDLTPEQLAAQEQSINEIRAEANTSDPVANLIAKGIASSTRNKARTEAIAQRVGQLTNERQRWDEQTRQNQEKAADTEAANIERAQQDSDIKLQARTNAMAARQELQTGTLEQMAKNVGTVIDYNRSAEAANEESRRNQNQAKIYAHFRAAAVAIPNSEAQIRELQEAEKLAIGYTPKQILPWWQVNKITLRPRPYAKQPTI